MTYYLISMGLKNFVGHEPVKNFYTDNGGELIAAARELEAVEDAGLEGVTGRDVCVLMCTAPSRGSIGCSSSMEAPCAAGDPTTSTRLRTG